MNDEPVKPEGWNVGDKAIIDKDFANGGPVEIVQIYGKHFCRVKDEGGEWDTMIHRLSKP